MGLGIVCHLVTHAWSQNDFSAIHELSLKLAFETKQDMTFRTPVVGEIAWHVIDHADAYRTKLAGAPVSNATLAFMLCWFNFQPICCCERESSHVHQRHSEMSDGCSIRRLVRPDLSPTAFATTSHV